MKRLTVNKSKDEMNMVELAHNCCFAKDGKAMYRDYDTIIDAREFARNLIRASNLISADDEIFTNDTAFDEFMSECLFFSPFNNGELIALFYRNLWAQADLYERLKHYEDLQEQGRLLELPCRNWMDIVFGEQQIFWGIDRSYIENPIREITVDNSERITWYDGWKTIVLKGVDEDGFDWEFSPDEIGKIVFLTREEAEQALEGETE